MSGELGIGGKKGVVWVVVAGCDACKPLVGRDGKKEFEFISASAALSSDNVVSADAGILSPLSGSSIP